MKYYHSKWTIGTKLMCPDHGGVMLCTGFNGGVQISESVQASMELSCVLKMCPY